MSRIERLVNLTAALLATERALTAEELRDRVPGYPDDKASFRRQFERDKDALRELGLPLLLESQRMGGEEQSAYRIDPDRYYLRDPGLSPDELSALHLASRMVRVEGLSAGDGMWKLAADRLDALDDVSVPGTTDAQLPAAAALSVIFQAIGETREVHFVYRGDDRLVVPRSLAFRTGHWYLSAFDMTRSDERSFRVDRIEGDVMLGGPAVAPPSPVGHRMGHPWELGEGVPVEALVRIDGRQAPWAVRHLGSQAVRHTSSDGAVTVALSVRSPEALRSFVLGFLDGAVVLEPPELRALMIDWLTTMMAEPGI